MRVVAAVVRRDGQLLVCQRPDTKRHGGLWEFPGGKLQEGEQLAEAVARELREELDVTVEGIGPVLFSRQDPGSPYLIEFVEVSISGTPRALEHAAIAWVMGRELKALDLAPTDRAFVECYLNSED
jgi:mutator protein MutT